METKNFRAYMPYNKWSALPKSLAQMSLTELIKLRENKIIKRDHSMTNQSLKKSLRDDIWQLDDLITAHQKANEFNSLNK